MKYKVLNGRTEADSELILLLSEISVKMIISSKVQICRKNDILRVTAYFSQNFHCVFIKLKNIKSKRKVKVERESLKL